MFARTVIMRGRWFLARGGKCPRRRIICRPMRAAFQVLNSEAEPFEPASHRLDMYRFPRVRGAGKRKLFFTYVECIRCPAFNQWQRLQGLDCRAEIDRTVNFSPASHHLTRRIAYGSRDKMTALHHRPACHRHGKRKTCRIIRGMVIHILAQSGFVVRGFYQETGQESR